MAKMTRRAVLRVLAAACGDCSVWGSPGLAGCVISLAPPIADRPGWQRWRHAFGHFRLTESRGVSRR